MSKARLLYCSPVGGAAVNLLPATLDVFLKAGADCLLLQYDKARLTVPDGVTVIKDAGYKWQLAIRHLHPDFVDNYDYIFFWDDDIYINKFDPQRFARIMDSNDLDMAQPAISSPYGVVHDITAVRKNPAFWMDEDGPRAVVGRLTNFVEIMVPVFTRAAWRELYGFLEPENQSGWGYDYVPLGNKGVVDAMPVVHTRPVQSGGEDELIRFLQKHELERHKIVDKGWLFE